MLLRQNAQDAGNILEILALPFFGKANISIFFVHKCCFLASSGVCEKNSLKVSLHYKEDETKLGLLRIDFNSGHKNPETITEDVPTKFHPYVGKVFTNQEHHVHYHVQSFPSLAWAIPLVDDGFEVKELNEGHDFYVNFSKAVTQFAKVINLQTHITFNVLLL